MTDIKIQKLTPSAKLPTYATNGSAAADLRSSSVEDIVINPGESALIPTGLAIALPNEQLVAIICARSGLASKFGICLANGIGVIDSDYRGELKVALKNLGSSPFTVHRDDRIAQLMIMPVVQGNFVLCSALEETARGAGGFGSTGIG